MRALARRWPLVLTTAALLAAGFLLTRSQEPRLMARATRVAGLQDWLPPYYWWLPDGRILYVRDDLKPKGMSGEFSLMVADPRTGASYPMASCNALLRKSWYLGLRPSWLLDSGWLEPSRDGNWLLWMADPNPKLGWAWIAMRTDGSHVRLGPQVGVTLNSNGFYPRPMTRWCWQRDSRYWIALSERKDGLHAQAFGVDGANALRDVVLDPGHGTRIPTTCLGMTTAHHLLATTWDQDNSGGFGSGLRFIDLYDFDIDAPRAHVRRQTLRIPIGSRDLVDVRDLVLSPDSRELAWRIHCERDWRALWLVRWLPPFLSWSPKPGTELWVSRLDGTRMRLVGTCPDNQREDSNDREYEPGQPRYVRWTPDGRRLSFYWRRAIWTVAAD